MTRDGIRHIALFVRPCPRGHGWAVTIGGWTWHARATYGEAWRLARRLFRRLGAGYGV